MQGAAKDSGRF